MKKTTFTKVFLACLYSSKDIYPFFSIQPKTTFFLSSALSGYFNGFKLDGDLTNPTIVAHSLKVKTEGYLLKNFLHALTIPGTTGSKF